MNHRRLQEFGAHLLRKARLFFSVCDVDGQRRVTLYLDTGLLRCTDQTEMLRTLGCGFLRAARVSPRSFALCLAFRGQDIGKALRALRGLGSIAAPQKLVAYRMWIKMFRRAQQPSLHLCDAREMLAACTHLPALDPEGKTGPL